MKTTTVVFAFTRIGAALCKSLCTVLGARGFAMPAHATAYNLASITNLQQQVAAAWQTRGAIIFIGATGIAVRAIAPLVQDKRTDPAVVCIDEQANHVIPLLSGHLGGANALAQQIAQHTGAALVLSTATDLNHCFAVDNWAKSQNLFITDMQLAKAVSAALLEGTPVGFASDYSCTGPLPTGLVPLAQNQSLPLGIYLSHRQGKQPFAKTLQLIPPVLCVGMGCRKGVAEEPLTDLLKATLAALHLHPQALCCIATATIKEKEPGLLALCNRYNLPLCCYTPAQLMAVEGTFAPSALVQKTVNADNVCHRASACAAGPGYQTILQKTANNGMTIAITIKDWEVKFNG